MTNKFKVNLVIREAAGFRYIPLMECDGYEEAQITVKAYKRRNPGLSFCIDHPAEED